MPVVDLGPDVRLPRETLGGKAWSLVRMLSLGMPVPPAFTLTTEVCGVFQRADRLPEDVELDVQDAVRRLEQKTGRTFGRGPRPLLVSVRSGAPTSMPGMMDTLLNVGLTDQAAAALGEMNPDLAGDLQARLRDQFAATIGVPPPGDGWQQLLVAIAAVFRSWESARARHFRAQKGIADDVGTSVTVQAMVFGNADRTSGTGVIFSRDPTGVTEAALGEWLPGAQGEDVVSGTLDPQPLSTMAEAMPAAHRELLELATRLEGDAGAPQDIEFTVESGKLWLLQTRNAKVQNAVRPLADEREPEGDQEVVARGRPACPGTATGVVVADTEEAERRALSGESIILARPTTDPQDIHAMSVVAGILTEVGGATSHAAVVSRELQVPCIVGCGQRSTADLIGKVVSIDAARGTVVLAALR